MVTGVEVEVVKDGAGAVLKTITTSEDTSGNDVILEVMAGGATTETVTDSTGGSQVTST